MCFNDCCDDVQGNINLAINTLIPDYYFAQHVYCYITSENDIADTYFTLVKCMMMYTHFEQELKV